MQSATEFFMDVCCIVSYPASRFKAEVVMSSVSFSNSYREKTVDFFKANPDAAIIATGVSLLGIHAITTDLATATAKITQAGCLGFFGAAMMTLLKNAYSPLEIGGLLGLSAIILSHINQSSLQTVAGLAAGVASTIPCEQNDPKKPILKGIAVSSFIVATILD